MRLTQDRVLAIVETAEKLQDKLEVIRSIINVPKARIIDAINAGETTEAISLLENLHLTITHYTTPDRQIIEAIARERMHFDPARLRHNERNRRAVQKSRNKHRGTILLIDNNDEISNHTPIVAAAITIPDHHVSSLHTFAYTKYTDEQKPLKTSDLMRCLFDKFQLTGDDAMQVVKKCESLGYIRTGAQMNQWFVTAPVIEQIDEPEPVIEHLGTPQDYPTHPQGGILREKHVGLRKRTPTAASNTDDGNEAA